MSTYTCQCIHMYELVANEVKMHLRALIMPLYKYNIYAVMYMQVQIHEFIDKGSKNIFINSYCHF